MIESFVKIFCSTFGAIIDLLRGNASLFLATLTAIGGFFIGHYLSIGRERRKEFNRVATPIHLNLLQQIEILEQRPFVKDQRCEPVFSFVTQDGFRELGVYLNRRTYAKYIADIEKYKKAIEGSGYYGRGGWYANDIQTYIKASRKMLTYTKRR